MKVRVGDKIIDPDKEPVVFMFEDDNDRLLVANHLTTMAPRTGSRAYMQYPTGTELASDYMEESLKMAGYL